MDGFSVVLEVKQLGPAADKADTRHEGDSEGVKQLGR